MSKLRVTFTYPVDVVQEPVIWLLSQKFEVKTNIRRADVQENLGWVTLELEGEEGTVLREAERGQELEALAQAGCVLRTYGRLPLRICHQGRGPPCWPAPRPCLLQVPLGLVAGLPIPPPQPM